MKIKNFDTKKKILIVGEIGNNHEGCFETAKKLINMAAKAGVDAVIQPRGSINDKEIIKFANKTKTI